MSEPFFRFHAGFRRGLIVLAAALTAGFSNPTGLIAQTIGEVERVRAERSETEDELTTLEGQIEEFESQLSAARSAEQSAANRMADIDNEIAMRQKLVSTYTQRNRQLTTEAEEVAKRIEKIEADFGSLTDDYKRRVIHAYKHGRSVYLAMILSAESLDRLITRVRYLRRFTAQRRERVAEIRTSTGELAARQVALQMTISENAALAAKGTAERKRLTSLRADRSKILAQSRRDRSTIESEIASRREEVNQLNSRIQELIASEAERMRAATEKNPLAAAEFEEIATRFDRRKGALSWPTTGTVTEPFGTRVHPEYGTETLNPGIQIATKSAAVVKAVFEGQVTRIFFLPGYGTCVTVRHGAYTSMYANLSSVRVSNQQRVTAGQILGETGTAAEPRQESLFFALFASDGEAENPTDWLRPR